jgi:predicted DNA-binding transcriptional regulator AlpA
MPTLPEFAMQTANLPGESHVNQTARSAVTGTPVARSTMPRRLVKEREAAEFLGLSRAFLRASRLRNPRCAGPPYIRVGRAVRYDVRDLEDWVKDHRLTSVV